MNAIYPDAITVQEAHQRIATLCHTGSKSETVSLTQACGRVLASDITSPLPVPAYDNSAMDGYAVSLEQLAPLLVSQPDEIIVDIIGQSRAGHPPADVASSMAHAMDVTTGAAIINPYNCVIPFEFTSKLLQPHKEDKPQLRIPCNKLIPNANIRHKGEDIAVGDVVLKKGEKITPAHLALLAGLGIAQIPVYPRIKVAVITTGDEVVNPGESLPNSHVYNANAPFLASWVQNIGAELTLLTHCKDDPEFIAQTLQSAANTCDLILITGGAAASQADHTHRELARLGHIQNWTINMRPGRPMRVGLLQDKLTFVLPGNPTAAMMCALEFVRPAIQIMQGTPHTAHLDTITAKLTTPIRSKPGRAEFIRAVLNLTQEGNWQVTPLSSQSSASIRSLTQANAVIVVDHQTTEVSAGNNVVVQRLEDLMH